MICLEELVYGKCNGEDIKVKVRVYKRKREVSWWVKVFPFLKYCYGAYESY